jgi:hypothetical protein
MQARDVPRSLRPHRAEVSTISGMPRFRVVRQRQLTRLTARETTLHTSAVAALRRAVEQAPRTRPKMATSGREPVGHAAANAEKARGDEGIVVSRRARPDEDRNGSRAPVVHPERQVRSAP